MSEGKQDRDMAATVNEGEGKVAVSSTVNEGEEKTGATPMVDEGHEMDNLSPVISYEPGIDDRLEPFTSEGETKYEGKGKDRSESFSHLPTPVQSDPRTAPSTRPVSEVQNDTAPSTAPSTRPVSEVKNDSGPSTAPSTRPVSEVQNDSGPSTAPSTRPVSEVKNDSGPSTAPTTRPLRQAQDDPSTSTAPTTKPASQAQTDPEPSMTDSISPATEEKGDSAVLTTQGDSVSATGQGNSATPIGLGGPAAIADKSGSGSIEPQHNLPPRNFPVQFDCGCQNIYDGTGKTRQQACAQHRLDPKRSELPSPPKKPLSESTNLPRVRPYLSGDLPQAIGYEERPPKKSIREPTAAPSSPKNFTSGISGLLKSAPKLLGPKAPEPTAAPSSPNPPHAHEDASESQTEQPRNLDAVEGQDSASRLSTDEQRTSEEGGNKPKRVEVNEEDEIFPLPSDEDYLLFAGREGEGEGERGGEDETPLPPPPNSPHHRHNIQPKSILKKPVHPPAEAGRGLLDEDAENQDRRQGARLFQATIARLRASASSEPRVMAGSPIRVERGGRPTARLVMETHPGQEASEVVSVDSDNEDGACCERAAKKWCPKCVVM